LAGLALAVIVATGGGSAVRVGLVPAPRLSARARVVARRGHILAQVGATREVALRRTRLRGCSVAECAF
jgi:hypothetical protein